MKSHNKFEIWIFNEIHTHNRCYFKWHDNKFKWQYKCSCKHKFRNMNEKLFNLFIDKIITTSCIRPIYTRPKHSNIKSLVISGTKKDFKKFKLKPDRLNFIHYKKGEYYVTSRKLQGNN